MDSANPLKRQLPFIALYQLHFSSSDALKGKKKKTPERKRLDKIEYDNRSLGKENREMSIMKVKLLNKTKIIHNDFPYVCCVLLLV